MAETVDWNEAILELLQEVYDGPSDPSGTWIVDNEPKSGLFGTLARLSADQASETPPCGRNSVAAHAAHLRFGIRLANAYHRGETPSHDWESSWKQQQFSETEWKSLLGDLRAAYEELTGHVRELLHQDQILATGTLAGLAHAAFHLGAIRQLAWAHLK